MKRIYQKDIAILLGISPSFLSEVFNGNKRLSPKAAKRIGERLGLEPTLLLYGTPRKIRATISHKIRLELTS